MTTRPRQHIFSSSFLQFKGKKALWGISIFTWLATILATTLLYFYGYSNGFSLRVFEIMAVAIGVNVLLVAFLLHNVASSLVRKTGWIYFLAVPFVLWMAIQCYIYVLVYQYASTNDPVFKYAPIIARVLGVLNSATRSMDSGSSGIEIVQGLFLNNLLVGSVVWVCGLALSVTYQGLRVLISDGALRYWKHIFITLLCLTVWIGISFVVPSMGADEVQYVRQIKLESEFPVWANSSVYSLIEDPTGELWAGTNAGLYVYSSKMWHQDYNLANDRISTFLKTLGGDYWVGTDKGLYRRTESGWETLNLGLPENVGVTALLESQDHSIWVATSKGIYRTKDNGYELEELDPAFQEKNIRDLQEFQGEVWAGTGSGVYRYVGKGWESVNYGLPENVDVIDMLKYKGTLWAGTATGIYRFIEGNWEESTGLPNNIVITTLLAGKDGSLWAGTNMGVYRYANDAWSNINDGLIGVKVLSLLESQGGLWAGTDGGIYRYDGRKWNAEVEGLPAEVEGVMSLIETREGELWAGVLSGLYHFSESTETWVEEDQGFPDGIIYVWSLLEDRSGTLWAGTSAGVYRYIENEWQAENTGLPVGEYWVWDLVEKKDGTIWAGIIPDLSASSINKDTGVYRYLGGIWERQSTGLPPLDSSSESVLPFALMENSEGKLLTAVLTTNSDGLGTSSIYSYQSGTWEEGPSSLEVIDGFGIITLIEDQEGTLWAGTLGDGVYRYINGAWVQENNGFSEGIYEIWSLLENKPGEFWIGTTGRGVYRNTGDGWVEESSGLPETFESGILPILKLSNGDLLAGVDRQIFHRSTGDNVWEPAGAFKTFPSRIYWNKTEDSFVMNLNTRFIRIEQENSDWKIVMPLSKDYLFENLKDSSKFVLGSGNSLQNFFIQSSPFWVGYSENRFWISTDGISWNPITTATASQLPVGAFYDKEDGIIRYWTISSASVIDEYFFELPVYGFWPPVAFLIAVGRSPVYWYPLAILWIAALAYFMMVYLLAGQSNQISPGQFIRLNWNQPGLLYHLLNRGEHGYTALRLQAGELSSLARLLYLSLDPKQPGDPASIAQEMSDKSIAVDREDLNAAMRELSNKGLVRAEGASFRFLNPSLAEVYQQTADPAMEAELVSQVQRENSSYVNTCRFFVQAGSSIESGNGNTLVLSIENHSLQERIGTRALVRIMPDQPLRISDVQVTSEAAKSVFGKDLKGRVAFIIVDQPPDAGARAAMYAYRWDEGFTIIPVSRSRIRQALAEDICFTELSSVLADYLTERPDLYDRSIPVRDENFFGRSQVIEELSAYLNEDQPVGIFALNKMGKTSLVRNLVEHLRDRAVSIVDLQSLTPDARVVYGEIVKGFAHDIVGKWAQADLPPLKLKDSLILSNDFSEDFTQDMERLYQFLAGQISDPRFVIFVDEIDRLIPGADHTRAPGFVGYNDLLAALRGLSQKGLPLTFVAVGIQPQINRQSQLAGVENAGFQMFRELFLPPMTREECNQMIVDIGQQMGLKYSEAALSRIFEESGGHPFLARQLCSKIWGYLNEIRHGVRNVEIDEKDVEIAVRSYLKDGRCLSYHEQTWSTRLTEREQDVVQRLACADEPQPRLKGERSTLNSLRERHIVIEENDTYRLSFGLFKRWVRLNILDFREG